MEGYLLLVDSGFPTLLSTFWNDLSKIRNIFLCGTHYKGGKGAQVRFWLDKCSHATSFRQLPNLFATAVVLNNLVISQWHRSRWRPRLDELWL